MRAQIFRSRSVYGGFTRLTNETRTQLFYIFMLDIGRFEAFDMPYGSRFNSSRTPKGI